MIKYIDLGVSEKEYDKEISPRIKDIFINGNFISDTIVEEFEKNFASYCGVKYAIALNSGTDALIFALKSLNIGPGDEVITVSNSFIATANAISYCGATPVFVDINDNLMMDTKKVKELITANTKAIMPVQLMGHVCEMDDLKSIANKFNLFIIEDAAQSVGSKYGLKKTGNLADISCFSLHPLKNLSGITDGGIITTNNKQVVNYLKEIRNHGLTNRDEQNIIGRVSRLNSLNAITLDYRLTKLDSVIHERRVNAKIYNKLLENITEVSLINVPEHIFHSYHTYIIKVEKRDKLQRFLLKKGIETKIHYPIPIHKQKPFMELSCNLSKTESLAKRILTLPLGNLSIDDINHICNTILDFYKNN